MGVFLFSKENVLVMQNLNINFAAKKKKPGTTLMITNFVIMYYTILVINFVD